MSETQATGRLRVGLIGAGVIAKFHASSGRVALSPRSRR